MDYAEIFEQIIRTTRFASDILSKLPRKNDGKLTKYIKYAAIADSFYTKYIKEDNSLGRAIKKLKATKINNEIIKDIFFQTNLKEEFNMSTNKVTDNENIVNAQKDDNEIHFVEYSYSYNSWIDSDFFVKNINSLDSIIETLWTKYDNKIHVEYNWDAIERKRKVRLDTITKNPDPLLGKSDDKLLDIVKYFNKYKELNISRTYCFLGLPGTGKSTFAIKFAEAVSDRIVRFNAQELSCVLNSIGQLILALKPKVLIFDDFDRLSNINDYIPTILTLMEEIKRRFPNILIIITANDIKPFGTALLRPGRIDEIIEFDPPTLDDIKLLLEFYMNDIGAEFNESDINQLAELSQGLSHSYIKELAIRKRVFETDHIVKSIEKMKTMAAIKPVTVAVPVPVIVAKNTPEEPVLETPI